MSNKFLSASIFKNVRDFDEDGGIDKNCVHILLLKDGDDNGHEGIYIKPTSLRNKVDGVVELIPRRCGIDSAASWN